jgi:hypothetical protein
MINQNHIYHQWIAKLSTNPGKATNFLDNGRDQCCCLGWLCHAAGYHPEHKHGKIYFDNASTTLPMLLAKNLNIRPAGDLTTEGQLCASLFVARFGYNRCYTFNYYSGALDALTTINDKFFDMPHNEMAQLIQYLAYRETLSGKDCFKPYIA